MELNQIMHVLFFPGIVLHECAHAIACIFLNVPIKRIKLIGKNGGFVVHGDSRSYKIIMISLFPFIFNILIALFCARIFLLTSEPFYKLLLVWIGIPALFFSVPSDQDTNNSFETIKKSYTKKQETWKLLVKILLSPLTLVLLIVLGIFKLFDKVIAIRLLLVGFWTYLFLV